MKPSVSSITSDLSKDKSHTGWLLKILLTINTLVVVLAVWTGINEGNVRAYFNEESFITSLSTVQLIAIALLSMGVYIRRCRKDWSWHSPTFVWLIIAVGFVFLAADEHMEIHERFDVWLHGILRIEENAITDRIDDVIVGLYGMAAAGLVYRYRAEMKRYRHVLPLLLTGFTFLFAMVFLDLLTNRPDILSFLLGMDMGLIMQTALGVLEEFCKLTACTFFVGSIYQAFRTAKSIAIDPA